MFVMRTILFLFVGLVLVYCRPEVKINNNNKNSNGEEFNLKVKPNSADLWKESLLSYMDSNKSPRAPCTGICTSTIQCVFWSGNINCGCSFFSCSIMSQMISSILRRHYFLILLHRYNIIDQYYFLILYETVVQITFNEKIIEK